MILAWCLILLCISSASSSSSFGVLAVNNDPLSCTSEICRGGGDVVSSSTETIAKFLETVDSPGKFFIQGWRWHTMAFQRDCGRLEKLALRLLRSSDEYDVDEKPLEKASDYVIDFNMKGLHRIENDLFFPWLQKQLTQVTDETLSEAFSVLIDKLNDDRRKIVQLGIAVKDQAKITSNSNISESKRSEAIGRVAQLSASLTSKTRGVLELEEKFLVPAVAALVSESDQKSFNNKVIVKLGILDSRLHLVGMYDAVQELDDKSERELFKEAIPYIPRAMIPRWRRNLYNPQASVLDEPQ